MYHIKLKQHCIKQFAINKKNAKKVKLRLKYVGAKLKFLFKFENNFQCFYFFY